ncbi:hypothetical protein ACTHAM_000980 [Cellulomonas soli]|uniref:hypothetical protein n=1 Tax=Cellulomonas soli TaxID=931535 RepID=UPI003F84940C
MKTDEGTGGPLLPDALRELWRHESTTSTWLRPSDWYHPAVDGLASAVLEQRDPTGAAHGLGHARGHDGVGITEALDDLACLYRSTGLADPPHAVVTAFCAGWADAQAAGAVAVPCLDAESGLPTSDYLSVRLAETYLMAARTGRPAHADHDLILLDVATGELHPFLRMARSAAVGAALLATYGHGHPMATLGGGAFAVLVRHDEATRGMRMLRTEVDRHCEALGLGPEALRSPARIWRRALPDTHDEAVQALTRAGRG